MNNFFLYDETEEVNVPSTPPGVLQFIDIIIFIIVSKIAVLKDV